jgi:hypothetical protein
VASDSAPPVDLRKFPCDCGLDPHLSFASEIKQALERDGWEIGSGLGSTESGNADWLVWGSKGLNQISAHGRTEERAWQVALEQARSRLE